MLEFAGCPRLCLPHQIIDEKDPRSKSPEITAAKRTEIAGLLTRGNFKVMLREEMAMCIPVALFSL